MTMLTQASALLAPGKDDQFFPTWMPDNRRVLTAIGRGPVRRMGRIDIDTRQTEEVKACRARWPTWPCRQTVAISRTTGPTRAAVWQCGASLRLAASPVG